MENPVFVTLRDQKLELEFTMAAWDRLEEEIGTLDELEEKLTARGRLRVIARAAAILAQHQDPEITAEYIFSLMEPRDVRAVSTAIVKAITQGLSMEEKPDGGQMHDVVLEEIDAKKERAD